MNGCCCHCQYCAGYAAGFAAAMQQYNAWTSQGVRWQGVRWQGGLSQQGSQDDYVQHPGCQAAVRNQHQGAQ